MCHSLRDLSFDRGAQSTEVLVPGRQNGCERHSPSRVTVDHELAMLQDLPRQRWGSRIEIHEIDFPAE
jgi:hypothetical protein